MVVKRMAGSKALIFQGITRAAFTMALIDDLDLSRSEGALKALLPVTFLSLFARRWRIVSEEVSGRKNWIIVNFESYIRKV